MSGPHTLYALSCTLLYTIVSYCGILKSTCGCFQEKNHTKEHRKQVSVFSTHQTNCSDYSS